MHRDMLKVQPLCAHIVSVTATKKKEEKSFEICSLWFYISL